jgi:hypothetical protein
LTLADLIAINDATKPLNRLLAAKQASADERALVVAGIRLLAKTIRNRDAHAYVPEKRAAHFRLVPELFVPILNLLAKWLPGGPNTIDQWRAVAPGLAKSQQ